MSPVANARIISGLVPCNVIAEEILTDHPDRYRAMFVESANPAHSLADGPRMRAALEALDFVVVIDVAMTETAQLADYVLPAASQFEKAEATFFNFEFPHNYFHLRRPVLDPLPGTLPEPEMHARIVEALGAFDDIDLTPLADAAKESSTEFGPKFLEIMAEHPELGPLAPVVLYRTLGPSLPAGTASAALLWGAAQQCAPRNRPSLERAGLEGEGTALGDALFDAILNSPSGVTFSVDDHADSWRRVRTPDGLLNLSIDLLIDELAALSTEHPPGGDPEFPFVLTAGERRSFTANTIFRDPGWRKRDPKGALRVSEADAAELKLSDGDTALLTTRRGSARVVIEVSPMMRGGHISLPNGLGVTYTPDGEAVGVAPNDLTSSDHRDPIAGTPYPQARPGPARAAHRERRGLGAPPEHPPGRCRGVAAGAGHELGVANGNGLRSGRDQGGDEPLLVPPAARDRRRLVAQVLVAPLAQPEQGHVEVEALLREPVVEAVGPIAVWLALEDAFRDELVEPVGQHVAGHPEALAELVEAAQAQERVPDDEKGPALTDDLERAGDRAVLPLIAAHQHRTNDNR